MHGMPESSDKLAPVEKAQNSWTPGSASARGTAKCIGACPPPVAVSGTTEKPVSVRMQNVRSSPAFQDMSSVDCTVRSSVTFPFTGIVAGSVLSSPQLLKNIAASNNEDGICFIGVSVKGYFQFCGRCDDASRVIADFETE